MKSPNVLREYVKRLSDEELRFLNLRFTQRVGSDLGEAVEFLQRNTDVDKWLSSAPSASDFYDMVDVIDVAIGVEVKKRFQAHEQKEKVKG